MCRLFGLSAAPQRVSACFWLLDAPDSLLEQSHRNPDGTGLAYFDAEQQPLLDKQPRPAFEDTAFKQEAKTIHSTTFVSHIRYATTGTRTIENTHPFAMKGRVMAHNGTLYDLPRLEERLGPYRDLVKGDTDSERYFALITQEIDAHAGDVGAGIAAAGRWIAENLPLVSINMLLATATDLWALRYPDQRTLYLLERSAGGPHGDRHLHLSSRSLRLHSPDLSAHPCAVIASERLDDNPGWRPLASGELVHVGPDLKVTSSRVIDFQPAHLVDDPSPEIATSQPAPSQQTGSVCSKDG